MLVNFDEKVFDLKIIFENFNKFWEYIVLNVTNSFNCFAFFKKNWISLIYFQ